LLIDNGRTEEVLIFKSAQKDQNPPILSNLNSIIDIQEITNFKQDHNSTSEVKSEGKNGPIDSSLDGYSGLSQYLEIEALKKNFEMTYKQQYPLMSGILRMYNNLVTKQDAIDSGTFSK
jgi:hypothetical protein